VQSQSRVVAKSVDFCGLAPNIGFLLQLKESLVLIKKNLNYAKSNTGFYHPSYCVWTLEQQNSYNSGFERTLEATFVHNFLKSSNKEAKNITAKTIFLFLFKADYLKPD